MITTQSDQTALNDGVLTSTVVYDGLGRTTETRTSAPEGTIYSKQDYDAVGRVKRTFNPYRTTSDGYADTAYDALGRVTTLTTSDTAVVTTVVTTTYSGNATTVTDQAGKKRRSVTDGLGQLIRVDEPDSSGNLDNTANPPLPLQPTSYVYSVLDDLMTVTQGTQPSRSFLYDSLKRLTDASNPESGHVQYTYDESGNLKTKIDARLTTTTYLYDMLNRVTSRSYTNDPQGTPAVAYYYDGQALPTLPAGAPTFSRGSSTGRLVAVTYGVGNTGSYQGYDQLGRVVQSIQVTETQTTGSPNPQAYGMTYSYNLAGEMLTEGYPSGRVVQTEYDTAGRIAGVKNQGTTSYYAGGVPSDAANRIQYAAHGAVSVLKLGNGKWEHTSFNSRLQPTQIGLGTSGTDSSTLKLDYGYGTTGDNGNVLTQTITASGLTLTQCYGYDYLNRLSTAEERSGINCTGTQQWKQAFSYDRYGNRNFDVVNTTGNVLGPNPTITQSTNRFAAGQNYGYDSAGNLTSDPTTNVNGITYDAENRQTQYTKSGQTTNYYYYDGDGRRVRKIDSTGTTVFVYNVAGQLIAEYTSGTPSGGGTSYLTSDHLGSIRVVTDTNGGVKARHDYLPFGEEIQAGIGGRSAGQGYVADNLRQKFTQKERDNESGLDYFGARYYSSAQGRFTSVDPLLASGRIEGPQTWNRYAYSFNNPLRYIDPTGMFIWDATLGGTADDKDVSGGIRRKRVEIRSAITKANEALNSGKLNSTQKAKLERALNAYGAEGTDNGVKVAVGQVPPEAAAETSSVKPYVVYDQGTGDTKANILVTFKEGGSVNAQDFAHEGSHVADRQELVAAFQRAFSNSNPLADWLYLPENIFVRQTESRAFRVTAAVSQGLGTTSYSPGGYEVWNSGWKEADRSTKMQQGIKRLLTESPTYRDKLNKRLISER